MPYHRQMEKGSRRKRRREPHRGELLGPADTTAFGQHQPVRADLRFEMRAQRRLTLLTQAPRALLDHLAVELRHTCGRCAGPRREWKDVQLREAAVVQQS